MAGGNMGGLEMSLTLRSTVEKQLEKISGSITEASKKYEKLKEMLDKGLDVNGNPTTRTAKQTKELRDKFNDAEKKVRSSVTSFKSAEGRAEKLFKVCDQLDKVFETMGKNTDLAKSLHLGSAISQISDLELSIRAMRGEWINFLTSTAGVSQLSKGVGFTTTINGWKRELSGYEKELSGIYDSINVQSKQSKNLRKQGAKEAAKADEQAIKDELKAEQYYVTRKQRVEDAIQAMYDRRAKLAERMKSAPDFQKGQLQGVVEAINQVIARLSSAKDLYEKVQTLQAKGLPPDMIRALTGAGNKSETYLGRYTGMSELFGGDIKKGELPYNYVTSLYREVMDRTASPFSFQDRIANNKANAQMLVRGEKEIERQEQRNISAFEKEQTDIGKTIDRYYKLRDAVKEALSVITTSKQLGLPTADIEKSLRPVIGMMHELHRYKSSGTATTNFYNTGEDKHQIDTLAQLTAQQKASNSERIKAIELERKLQEANRTANEKTAVNAQKSIQKEEEKTIKGIDDTRVRYRELQRIFSEGLSIRKNSFLSSEEMNRLNAGLSQLTEKLLNLRSYVNDGTKAAPYLFNTGNAKNQIKDLQDLISLYESNIKSRSRDSEKAKRDYDRQAEKDRRQTERVNRLAERDYVKATRESGQAAQTELNRQQRIIDMRNREEKALDATTKRYIQLYDVLKSLQSVRSDRLGLGGDVTKLDSAISNLLPKVRELHDAAYSGRAARTLYNSAASQRDIDLAKQLASDEAKVNKELEKQIELDHQRAVSDELANRKANSRMAVQADRDNERKDKENLRSFEKQEEQIKKTIERYYELSKVINEAKARIADARSRGLDYSGLVKGLQPIAAIRHEIGNAMRAQGYSFDLYDKGLPRVQMKALQDLMKSYDDTAKSADKLAASQKKESETAASNLIANRDKVKNISSIIEAMQKRWADIQANPGFNGVSLPSGFNKQIKDLENLRKALQSLSNADLSKAGSVTDLLSRRHFGTLRREVNAVFSEIEKGYRKAERESNEASRKSERNAETVQRTYARLFDQLNALRNTRANANILGIDTKELDNAISNVLSKLKILRSYISGKKGWDPANDPGRLTKWALGTSADSKREDELVDRLIRKYQQLNSEKRKSNADVINQEARAARELASAFDHVHNSASKSSRVISDIKSLFFQGGIVFGAQQLFNELVRTGGEIVQQHVALQTIVGDLQDANQLFGQIQDLALRSPFTFGELNRDVKQLAAFGVETDNLYDKTRRIADISSGLGVSFERLGLAYGQVKARSWLDGKELRQFAYAGLPMLQKLADYYSKTRGGAYTTSDVRDMITKRQVSFEDVDAIFDELTDKGGQFYNMQDKLSQTLLGRYMKLKDAWDIMLSGFADGQTITGKFFSFILDRVTDLVQAFDKIGPVIAAAFSGYAAKRLLTTFGGRAGADIIAAKQSLSVKLQEKALTEQLSAAEMRIVQTKNKITAEDLQNESILRQINQQEVRRLFITGQITKAQYKQLMASNILGTNSKNLLRALAQGSLLFQNAGNWGARLGATIGLIGGGLKTLGKSLWGMIGGLPGLLITGLSMGIAYLWQQHEELVQAQERAQEELSDRGKQMAEFLKNYNVNDIIAKGSDAVDNAIEAYKDKLKEIAPYNYDAYVMTANEKQSHEERLRYLSEQLELLKQANNIANNNSSNFVDETRGSFEDALKDLRGKIKANGTFTGTLADPLTGTSLESRLDSQLDEEMKNLADKIAKVLPGIGKDSKVTEAAKQLMSNMMAQLSFSPQEELYFRVKLGKLLHIPGSENALADEARARLQKLIQTAKVTLSNGITETGEQLAYKIRYGQKLSDAEKKKLNDLYDQALAQLRRDFPSYASELQTLLNNADFRADIRLNFIGGEAPSEYEKQIMSHVPAIVNEKIRSKVSEWSKLGSYEGNNKAKSEIDATYNQMLADQDKVKKGKITQSVANISKQNYEDLLTAANYFGYDYLGEKKKSNKPPKADHSAEAAKRKAEAAARKADQDAEKRLRARLQLINDAYETYKKYHELLHNENEAAKTVSAQYKDKGLSNEDVAKIQSEAGYRSLIEDAIADIRNWQPRRPSEMKERKDELIASGVKKINDIDFNHLSEQIKNFASGMNLALDKMSRTFNNYQTLYKATGNADFAAEVSGLDSDKNALRGLIINKDNKKPSSPFVESYSDYLKNYLDEQIRQVKFDNKKGDINTTYIDYDKLYKMSDKEIEKYAGELLAGSDADKVKIQGFITVFKKLRDLVTDNDFKEGVQVYADLMNKIVTEGAQQERNNQEHDENARLINIPYQAGKADKNEFNKVNQLNDLQTSTKNLQAEDAYKQFMGQVTSMTKAAAKDMRDNILANLTAQFEAGTLSAEDYIQQIKQVNSQFEEFSNQHSNIYSFLTGGLNGLVQNMQSKFYDKLRDDIKNNRGKIATKNEKTGEYELTDAGKKIFGKSNGAAKTVAMVDAIVNGVNSNVQSYKKLEDTWTDAFGDGLKNSGFSRFMGGFMEASQGAADAWNSLKNGDIVGTLEGGIRSFTGWFSWGNAAVNRRYEKQAEYLKNIQGTVSEINSNLKKRMENTGGSAVQRLGESYKANLGNEAAQVRQTYYDWSQAHTIHRNHRNRMYTNLDYDAINAYLRSIGYQGEDVGGDTIQNLSGEDLSKVREAFAGQWANLPEEARNYLNRLIEIESETGEIVDTTKEIGKALTDLDTDNLRSEYKDLLDDLDSDNEDFSDNLEKHLRNAILSGMISNLYKDEIDKMVNEAAKMADTKSGKYVDKNGNVRTHTGSADDIKNTASEFTQEEYEALMQTEEGLAERLRGTRDMLKDLYGWSDSNSSSMSSSIKGISEQTADLLASYVNAIRADVSVIRVLDSDYLPKLDITATAQLQQLNMITENTRRNAEAAEVIRDSVNNVNEILTRASNGVKPLHVDVK